ncbi:MAG TPA: anti-anti-sigma factor [Gammaproteobacteria bacterium]|nr:anti-anti-sigma factor [Gammaproteobacteria bacterium]|tara:strand:+ start:378 stop:689 length:312 start_codon:yes stop_codon:yes gene_type:complete
MEINSQLSSDLQALTLTLLGKFDYTCHQAFQNAYEASIPTPARFVVDILEVPSIDSSALGMLLLLRNHAGGDSSDVRIINVQADVFKLLQTCKFDELFKVDPQ